MRIFIARSLHQIEICIAQNEPFCACILKINLDPRMCSLTLTIEDDAIAELVVSDALPEPNALFGALTDRWQSRRSGPVRLVPRSPR